jgi:hypothetical protein
MDNTYSKVKEKTPLEYVDEQIKIYSKIKATAIEENSAVGKVLCEARIDVLRDVKAFIIESERKTP